MKKFTAFVFSFIIILFCFHTYAFGQEYGNTFPSYLNFCGGVYIEVESSFGTGSIVLPAQYKNDTISFNGHSGYSLVNCTNSMVAGRFVTSGGQEYYIRFQSWGTAEIRVDNSYSSTYEYLTVRNILNTNCNFTDNASDRQTDEIFEKYDFSYDEKFYISFAVIALFIVSFIELLILFSVKKGCY